MNLKGISDDDYYSDSDLLNSKLNYYKNFSRRHQLV